VKALRLFSNKVELISLGERYFNITADHIIKLESPFDMVDEGSIFT